MRSWSIPVALVLLATDAAAQSATGRVQGRVADPAAAALADVVIEVIGVDDARWSAVSNSLGEFTIESVLAGVYQVRLSRTGFRTAVAADVRVVPGGTASLDVRLELGLITDTVEVVGLAGRLDTVRPQFVFELTGDEVIRIPANGRNPIALLLAAPGVTATNPQSFASGQRMTSGGRPYVNGNRKEMTSFVLDGMDVNQATDNLLAYLPSPDALDAVALTTAAAPAEVGNHAGGVVTMRLRTGTNVPSGTVFGLVRDERLNAAGWARNWQPVDPLNPGRRTPLTHWTTGTTLGGPLRKNRLFAFADFQQTHRDVGPLRGLLTVATAAMRQGDFSTLLSGPNPQQLYDPLTTRVDPANPSRFLREPFPGNQIPLSRFNRVATALFAHPLYPLPTRAALIDNLPTESRQILESRQGDASLDGRLGDAHRVSLRLSAARQRTTTAVEPSIFAGGSATSPFASASARWAWQGVREWSSELAVGITDVDLRSSSDDDGADVGALGQTLGIAAVNDRRDGLPQMAFGGAASSIGNQGVVQIADSRAIQVQHVLSRSTRRISAKVGVLALHQLQDAYFSGNSGQLGIIQFSGQYTRDLSDPGSLGSPLADFVLGYPNRLARGDFAEPWQHRSTLWAGFGQVHWRLADAVVADVGLRYEYRTPLVEARDRQVTYDVATGEPRFAGTDGNSRALYRPFTRDWQPRLAVAWSPALLAGRLVARAAYGASSYQEGTGTNLRLPLNPPYFNELDLVNADPTVLGQTVERGFDGLRVRDPLAASVLRAIASDYRPARLHQWHGAVEFALWPSALVSVAYVGQVGRHLAVPVNANQAAVPGGARPLDAVLPQIGSLILTSSIGRQRYDALQTTLRKLRGHGWSLVASHTWGRAFSDSRGFFSDSGQSAEPATFWPDPRNPSAEWGPSAFDAAHHVTVAWTLDVPVGRDRRWGRGLPSAVNALVGGWSLDGMWRAHTGYALTVLAPDQSRTGARSGRPDRRSSGRGDQVVGPGGTWFDTTAFVLPQLGTFGNTGTGIVRGPGLNVLDVAVGKRAWTAGRVRLDLRLEAYNVLNTPVFDAPDRQITSAAFGQVRGSQLERELQLGVRWVY